jgi:putative tryptophan/tyrosine transport system substrate-binding protein
MLCVGAVSGQPRSVGFWQAFDQRMAELGYQDGKYFSFELLHAPTFEAFASGYAQLLADNPDILIASGPKAM